MSYGDEGGIPPASKAPAKGGVSLTRNLISLALLLLFGTAAALEVWATTSFNKAVERIETVLDQAKVDRDHSLVTLSAVNKILGKNPDGEGEDDGWQIHKSYTWQGIRKHVLVATYQPEEGKELYLTGVQVGK